MIFLVDTGSDVSCIPPPKDKRINNAHMVELFAANNSRIKTYGIKSIDLSFGLRRKFKWDFITADVSIPITGADFLTKFGLLVDLRKRKLIDTLTNLSSLEQNNLINVKTVSVNYHDILKKFPELTNPSIHGQTIKHDTVHFIEIKGQPVHAKVKRLRPEVFKETKKEFEYMIDQGICRPSKSN
ncbi:gag-pol polyprotein [Nephila pilipes]|uniref:Gag-pol polyprotein n=1 Tax=Nephila pilipes TaxID=299642 RepID=A0A8X6P153_NEPPI|nr:gag-pol polyprotein [Nephila pilipes]